MSYEEEQYFQKGYMIFRSSLFVLHFQKWRH